MVENIHGEGGGMMAPFTQELSVTVKEAIGLLEEVKDITKAVKKSISEWFVEKLDSLEKTDIDNLSDILPEWLVDNYEIILNIVKQVLQC